MSNLFQSALALVEDIDSFKDTHNAMMRVANAAYRKMQESNDSDHGPCFRASALGKPWVVNFLNYRYPVNSEESEAIFSVPAMSRMLDGIISQLWLEEVLVKTQDATMTSEVNLPQTLCGFNMVGHADIILTNQTTKSKLVIECKSMGGHAVKPFLAVPSNTYGYLSQLAYYHFTTRKLYPDYTVESCFSIYNRSTGVYTLRYMPEEVLANYWNTVQLVLSELAKIQTIEELMSIPDIIPPTTTKGEIPLMMRGGRWTSCFYETTNDGKTFTVRPIEDVIQLVKLFTSEPSDGEHLTQVFNNQFNLRKG